MKKILVVLIFIVVFIGAVGGSYLFVKNSYSTDNKNEVVENKKETEKVSTINEHIIEQNRFLTDWEWDSQIISKFPDDERYRVPMDLDVNLMRIVIDSEDVYKEYAQRISALPKQVDFSKNFVVMITTEAFKMGPQVSLKIADFTYSEDNGTMNIVLKEDADAGENAYLNYNAWYAVVNDRSLLRPATNVVIED